VPTSSVSKPGSWLALLLVAVLPHGTTTAQVQASASGPTANTSTNFRSALEAYRPYSSEKILDWKQANDNTTRIGGWREYARQAQEPDARPPTPADPALPDPHAGHASPVKP
jgi:hypothetical protein